MIYPHIPVNELYPQYPHFTIIKKYKKPAFSKMNLAKSCNAARSIRARSHSG